MGADDVWLESFEIDLDDAVEEPSRIVQNLRIATQLVAKLRGEGGKLLAAGFLHVGSPPLYLLACPEMTQAPMAFRRFLERSMAIIMKFS